MKNKIILFILATLFIGVALSSCADQDTGYCTDNSQYENAERLLDLIPFSLCGNRYRFQASQVAVRIPTDEELRTSLGPDYQPFFQSAIRHAIHAWNTELADFITLVPVHTTSRFEIVVGPLSRRDGRCLRGLTELSIVKQEPDDHILTRMLSPKKDVDHIIDAVRVTIGSSKPAGCEDRGEITEVTTQEVALHEIGHMLGIWGHSQDRHDGMCWVPQSTALSYRDIRTAHYVYSKSADIWIK